MFAKKQQEKKDEKKSVIVQQEKKVVPFTQAVTQAIFQGAIGAVVAAGLSAVTDPIVNRVLVQRLSVVDAIKQSNGAQMAKYFKTTLTTNLIKFPIYEVLGKVVDRLPISNNQRGIVTGAIFTTATLPMTNYRFCKSVGINVTFEKLYQAYLPTLARDIVYGLARTKMNSYIGTTYPHLAKTGDGRFKQMFASVMTACIVSSPGNELRGFVLQPKDKALSFSQFFQFNRFIRSSSLGAATMALSMGVSAIIANPLQEKFQKAVEKGKKWYRNNDKVLVNVSESSKIIKTLGKK